MNSFDELSIKEIVNEVPNGCLLGVPADYSGVPMQFTKELIKKGIKNSKIILSSFNINSRGYVDWQWVCCRN